MTGPLLMHEYALILSTFHWSSLASKIAIWSTPSDVWIHEHGNLSSIECFWLCIANQTTDKNVVIKKKELFF